MKRRTLECTALGTCLLFAFVCEGANTKEGVGVIEDPDGFDGFATNHAKSFDIGTTNGIADDTMETTMKDIALARDLVDESLPSWTEKSTAVDIGEWIQMGRSITIDPKKRFEMVAMSRDGNRMVISESGRYGKFGRIRPYQWNSFKSDWKLMGQIIEGVYHSPLVAMSANGIYIVTAEGQEAVRVFKWQRQMWRQVGESIPMWVGTSYNRGYFQSVAISDNGQTIAASMLNYRIRVPGQVKVFDWGGSKWKEKGHLSGSLNSLGTHDSFGDSIAMSGDGNLLAIGIPFAVKSGKRVGKAQVFKRRKGSSSWVQKGQDIYGKGKDFGFGRSIAISQNGSRVIIGEKRHRESGYARVVEWNESKKLWSMVGSDVEAEYNDDFGESVSISSDGVRVVAGARDFDEMVGPSGAGFARMFYFDGTSWLQLGNGLYGREKYSGFGAGGVSMAGSGNRVAIFSGNAISVYNFVPLANDALVVEINIKPFKKNHDIKISRARKEETVGVAVLTTDDFDAKKVDVQSIRFGPDMAQPVSWLKKDVNFDGIKDIILVFKLHHTGFSPGRQQACLHGEHTSGVEFKGCRIVRVTKAK